MNEELNSKDSALYTFYSAKKIYFAKTPSSFLLIEKRHESNNIVQGVSLVTRNTVIISKRNGLLLFPKSK